MAIAAAPVGPDIVATGPNDYPYSNAGQILRLPNGGFMMFWSEAAGADGSAGCVEARVYDAGGNPTSGVLIINTSTLALQGLPHASMLLDGTIMVTWQDHSRTSADKDSGAIRGQIITADGAKVGGEFLVNTTTIGSQSAPTNTLLDTGNVLVLWTDFSMSADDPSAQAIRGQIVTPTGAKVGGEFLVNTQTSGYQNNVHVAKVAGGNVMVTWIDATSDGSASEVKAQMFDGSGARIGGEFLVNTQTADLQKLADVAALANGTFVVTWQDASATLGDASGTSIKAQLFDGSGTKIGGEFLVNTGTTANNQTHPSVAGLSDGNFVIAWRDEGPTVSDPTLSKQTIHAQMFSATGVPIGSEFYGATPIDNTIQGYPAIADLGNGRFIISQTNSTVYPIGNGQYSQMTRGEHAQIFNELHQIIGTPDGETLNGTAGADYIEGQAGADTIHGLAGNDVIDAGDGNDTIYGEDGDDAIDGGAGDDTIDSGSGANLINGGDGNDIIRGHAGDQIDGGDDNDTITVDGAHATIYGGAGNDIIEGVSDQVYGEDGDDQIHVVGVNATDLIILDGGAGDDVITIDGANFFTRPFVVGGEGGDYLTGSFGDDFLAGGDGDDTLIGRGGANLLAGDGGNDVYVISSSADTIFDVAGGGYDTVKASVSYKLAGGVDVEVMRLLGTADLNLTGNEIAQTLVGNNGNNVLDGGGGGDSLKGRLGDDTYIVRNAADTIAEFASEGDDTVKAAVSYTLATGAEVEHLWTVDAAATTAINLTGNEFSHDLQGNAGVNVLTGGSGDDFLTGNGGADTLIGGMGNDTYLITDAAATIVEGAGGGNDRIKTTVSYVLAPDAQVETIQLAFGSAGTNVTGNGYSSKLIGNANDNVLDGGGGGDTLRGGLGNDTYIVRDANDRVVEANGEGTDVVQAAVSYTLTSDAFVETLRTIDASATTAINLTANDHTTAIEGNAGANVLTGGAGNETISGFAGNDMLFGGGGNDVFAFASGTGQDTVGDFVSGSDKLDLSAFFTSFAAVQAAMHDVGGNAVIDLGGGNSITLSGFLSAQLQSGDVIVGAGAAKPADAAHIAVVSHDPVDPTDADLLSGNGPLFHHLWGAGEPLTMPLV